MSSANPLPVRHALKTIRARRDELRASLRTLPPAERHTLAHDAERYLDQVKKTLLATFDDRRRDLFMWLPRFGICARSPCRRTSPA